MIWNAAVYCTQVEPDTLMVCCAAPWFSSIFSGVGHFRPTALMFAVSNSRRGKALLARERLRMAATEQGRRRDHQNDG
jgi:hypothetical protein